MESLLYVVALLVIIAGAFLFRRLESCRTKDTNCDCSAIRDNLEDQMRLSLKIAELLEVQSESLKNLEYGITQCSPQQSTDSVQLKDWVSQIFDQQRDKILSYLEEKQVNINQFEERVSLQLQNKLNENHSEQMAKISQMEQRIVQSLKKPDQSVSSTQPAIQTRQPSSTPEIILPTINGVQSQLFSTQFGSGWIIILDNQTGGFYTTWEQYCRGFGTIGHTFWIGLENLHRLTSSAPYELAIEMTDMKGERRYARYDRFEIGSKDQQFALLRLGRHSGTAGDGLSAHRNYAFSTYDHGPGSACSSNHGHGGWWFFNGSNCYESCLTGNANRDTSFGTIWGKFNREEQSTYLKCATMMI